MPHATGSLLEALSDAVGPAHVLSDPEVTASYATDWTGRFAGRARVVARPGTTHEVAAVLAACAARGVPVVGAWRWLANSLSRLVFERFWRCSAKISHVASTA